MIIHPGPNALSTFRQKKLLKELKSVAPQISGVHAQFYHFLNNDGEPSTTGRQSIDTLLTYGTPFLQNIDSKATTVFVIPRFGTISPWSSKATNIFHNAGLELVMRIERGVKYSILSKTPLTKKQLLAMQPLLHDRMVETVVTDKKLLTKMFLNAKPKPLTTVPVLESGVEGLKKANSSLGLALSDDEIEYLVERFTELERNPTDAELMMFSVANSEHCRHKIFNASWTIDNEEQDRSLFSMIRNTHHTNSDGVLSAYSDNGAVLSGNKGSFFFPDSDGEYESHEEDANIVIKVETHNHPTAIAPYPGAGTGSGGEIRDEGATGLGAKPKAGLTGFMVSNLNIPGAVQPWEKPYGKPGYIASPLQIMLEGPIGGAAFNNEFGRPNVLGFFRSFELSDGQHMRGYHKPMMLAGGLANIRSMNVLKKVIEPGDVIIVLGGPAMLIGLGGGSASSMNLGDSTEDLDFASVQRQNAEMQRRVQEVINGCWSQGNDNPIVSIHDVGAGGISNALPELVHDAGRGATWELRKVNNDEPGMSPMEIWSNEAQERYVLAIKAADLADFEELCGRERCPYAVVGKATEDLHFTLSDSHFKNNAVDIDSDVIFGKPPKMERSYASIERTGTELALNTVDLGEAIERVIKHPTVASKSFLITIGDRTVGGMVARDQMVGPWQVPVADAAVTLNSFDGYSGEVMALGERTPVAILNPAAAGRIAIAEVITNAVSADVESLSCIRLSANWMAAAGSLNEDQALFETVKAVGMEFCPELNMTIPVGKDSMSMRSQWTDDESGEDKMVVSPLSLVATGFAPVGDVRKTFTPQLVDDPETVLLLLDISEGKYRLGGSTLGQVYGQIGKETPDVTPQQMQNFFDVITELKDEGVVLAYHDRSDGGLIATLCEMSFAGHVGLDISVQDDGLEELFTEELGAVIQVRRQDEKYVRKLFSSSVRVAVPNTTDTIRVLNGAHELFSETRVTMHAWWSEVSHTMQKLRDNSNSALSEFAQISDDTKGLSPKITFDVGEYKPIRKRPKVMILREQGVNGHVEMAAAFDRAGFAAIDVHMSDIFSGRVDLNDFVGLAACGGFSYGDVLGAGGGWAKSILVTPTVRKQFKDFFERSDTFSLGVCNGCQMLAQLKEIIPGAEEWPEFAKNESEQFEARLSNVEIVESPSIMLSGMEGSQLLVPVAHGEGRAEFSGENQAAVAVRYVDSNGEATQTYPHNPNGSLGGETGYTTKDGRVTIMMPHPERVFRNVQLSWRPDDWKSENSPWMKMFQNAYKWTQK